MAGRFLDHQGLKDWLRVASFNYNPLPVLDVRCRHQSAGDDALLQHRPFGICVVAKV